MISEILALAANLALALSLIVAIIFGMAQVKITARDRKERLTLETLRNLQTREFSEFIQYLDTKHIPVNFKEFKAQSDEVQVMFIHYAQEMESLGLLVAEKYIEIDLVDKTLGSFVTTSWGRYKKVITDMREQMPDPFLCEYFQWLAERIDNRMTKNPREPFYKTIGNS